jgi:WD40 repeat protein
LSDLTRARHTALGGVHASGSSVFGVRTHEAMPMQFYSVGADARLRLTDVRCPSSSSSSTTVADLSERSDDDDDEIAAFRRRFRLGGGRALTSVDCDPLEPYCVAVCGYDRAVRLCDARKPGRAVTRQFVVDGPASSITSIAFDPCHGRTLLASASGSDIFMFDRDNAAPAAVRRFRGHTNRRTIKEVNFMARGRCVVSGSDDGAVYIWSTRTGKLLNRIARADNHVVNVVQPAPLDCGLSLLAVSGIDNEWRLLAPTSSSSFLGDDDDDESSSSDDNESSVSDDDDDDDAARALLLELLVAHWQ